MLARLVDHTGMEHWITLDALHQGRTPGAYVPLCSPRSPVLPATMSTAPTRACACCRAYRRLPGLIS